MFARSRRPLNHAAAEQRRTADVEVLCLDSTRPLGRVGTRRIATAARRAASSCSPSAMRRAGPTATAAALETSSTDGHRESTRSGGALRAEGA